MTSQFRKPGEFGVVMNAKSFVHGDAFEELSAFALPLLQQAFARRPDAPAHARS